MSQEMTVATPETAPPPARPSGRLRWRIVGLVAAVFVALSGVRFITGQPMLTDIGTIQTTLAFAVPIGLAGLGGLWAERAGIINIGLEGMMILGTWFSAYFAWSMDSPWAGLVAGIVGGMLGGLLHAVATVTFAVDHIVSGVAINILALGAMRYLSILFYEDVPGAGAAQSPQLPSFPDVGLPFVADLLAPVRATGWFLVSDLASLVAGLTTGMSAVTLLAILLVPGTFWALFRTRFGLRLRSCGENPDAAESLGVPVYTYKYIAVIISGGFAGMGGVFLAMVASSIYQEGQTGGRGYIGLAAMIFGNWRPGGLAMGATLFGYTDALQVRGGGAAVHALLLLIAIGLVAVAVWQWRRGARRTAIAAGVASVLLLAWYLLTDTLPGELVTYSPHIATLLVLALAAQRLRAPAAIGRQWRRS
ncbi:simple sugar transport system permease protein [Nocardiopsis mwathae]|uniref:Simple sugar transport system permease protein n=1 Tax=Nocardiopsis mwathae TaxID=1472723 RepID=A0A7W9YND1_9ACTN|nr:ABC transporter permease [Nocardiopsis mwathae]MBB6175170.1 simple sugar transport system permease protein [Nocardiopsis mwathae]